MTYPFKGTPRLRARASVLLAALLAGAACSDPPEEPTCGPSSGAVQRVVDGDTIELEDGTKIRYLMVDTPESTTSHECFGEEAKAFNSSLVLGSGKTVQLTYDQECKDKYGRLLAYVSVDGVEINRLIIERGYGCVLHIEPNGADRLDEYLQLQTKARSEPKRGLWSECTAPYPCGN